MNEIRGNGTFYKGIVPKLKANRIQIMHNYWQGVNSIIYRIDYEAEDEDDLCCGKFFMDTERHMAVQKTLDGSHIKRALGRQTLILSHRDLRSAKIRTSISVKAWRMPYRIR